MADQDDNKNPIDIFGLPPKATSRLLEKTSPEASSTTSVPPVNLELPPEDELEGFSGVTDPFAQVRTWRLVNGFSPNSAGLAPTKKEIEDGLDMNMFVPVLGADNKETGTFRLNPALAMHKGMAPYVGTNPSEIVGGKQIYYKGAGLTNQFGQLERKQYDSDQTGGVDARLALMTLNRSGGQTLALLKELFRTGFYQGREISNLALNNQGFNPTDEFAMANYMDYANLKLQTWEALLPQLNSMSSLSTGSGRKFTPESDIEIIAYANEISLALTGEKLNKAKLESMIRNTTATQRNAFYSGTQAPSTAAVAEQEIRKSSSAQTASYGLGNAIQLAFQALGS